VFMIRLVCSGPRDKQRSSSSFDQVISPFLSWFLIFADKLPFFLTVLALLRKAVLWIRIRIDFGFGWFWIRIKVDKNDPQKTKIEETYSFHMPDFLFGVQGPYSDPDPELDPH
jgi:hypothetical protein